MTAETSNARGEWVLVPREPTPEMIDAWRDAPNRWVEAYAAMLAAAPQPPSAPVAWITPGGDVSRSFSWCLERCLPGQQPRPLYTAQQPADAQAQGGGEGVAWRVPVLQSPFGERLDHGVRDELVLVMHRGTHGWKAAGQGHARLASQIYVKNVEPLCAASYEVAVVGLSGGGWRTVWARSDDDVTHPAPPSAPATQDGGEANMEVTVRDGAWVGTYAEWCRRKQAAPPSAPVGVEAIREAFDEISGLCRHLRQGGPAPEDLQDLSAALDEAVGIAANMLRALAQQPAAPVWIGVDWAAGQQPAAVDGALLRELRGHEVDRLLLRYAAQHSKTRPRMAQMMELGARAAAALAAQHQEPTT